MLLLHMNWVDLEDGGSMFLRNVGMHPQVCALLRDHKLNTQHSEDLKPDKKRFTGILVCGINITM
jgi:hypothetical protein